ncbi:hypothetical protein ABIA96_005431 [Bradyrhizobium sp. LB11.1]
MKSFKRFLRILDSVVSALEYWLSVFEDIVLLPIAYFEMKRRSYFDLPMKLRFSLMRFGLSKPYDPKLHHNILKKRRAKIEYDALEFLQKPDSRTKH